MIIKFLYTCNSQSNKTLLTGKYVANLLIPPSVVSPIDTKYFLGLIRKEKVIIPHMSIEITGMNHA